MNKTQVQTTGASLVSMAAGFAAGRGWLGLDAASWSTIFGAVVAVVAVLWPAVATRARVLKDTVAKSGDIVLTTEADAKALSSNPNIVVGTPELRAEVSK